MNPGDREWNLHYWGEKLKEAGTEATKLQKAWYANHNLTIEEQWKAMGLLMEYGSIGTLYNELLSQPVPEKTLWQRIRNK